MTEITPKYPDVPPALAGKVMLGDYGDPFIQAHMSVVVLVLEDSCRMTGGPRLYPAKLVHVTRGFEPAGSVARWTEGYWACQWHDGSATQGRRFLDTPEGEAQARALFATWQARNEETR